MSKGYAVGDGKEYDFVTRLSGVQFFFYCGGSSQLYLLNAVRCEDESGKQAGQGYTENKLLACTWPPQLAEVFQK
jgi:hypothetical protein